LWVLLLVALAGALSNGRSLWWSAAGALFALIVISVAWAYLSVNWLRLRRRTLTRVAQVGQILEEEFVLTNLSWIPKLWLEVRDFSTLPGHAASRVLGFVGGRRWRGWRVQTVCRERGRYNLGPLTLRSGDPLGVYQRDRQIARTSAILVHPAIFEFRQFPLPSGTLPGGDSLRRRTHYVTTNAAGVRDYATGDGINRIHWPTTARRQRLIVKEFELDPMSDAWIALDLHAGAHIRAGGEAGGEAGGDSADMEGEAPDPASPNLQALLPPSTEEYAVSMAASVARHFLRQDRSIGLVAYAQHREALASDRGERQLGKLLEMLSVLRAAGDVPFDRVLRAEAPTFQRGSTVVAISASTDLAWALAVQQMVRSGLRVVAVVVDGASFGGAADPAPLIGALAEAGAVVRRLRRDEPLDQAIEQPVAR
jgi:uncharacterized protein (DUF58 family)